MMTGDLKEGSPDRDNAQQNKLRNNLRRLRWALLQHQKKGHLSLFLSIAAALGYLLYMYPYTSHPGPVDKGEILNWLEPAFTALIPVIGICCAILSYMEMKGEESIFSDLTNIVDIGDETKDALELINNYKFLYVRQAIAGVFGFFNIIALLTLIIY